MRGQAITEPFGEELCEEESMDETRPRILWLRKGELNNQKNLLFKFLLVTETTSYFFFIRWNYQKCK